MRRSSYWTVTVLAGGLLGSSPLPAQEATPAAEEARPTAASVVFRQVAPPAPLSLERNAATAEREAVTEPAALPVQRRRSDSVALMVVGGAAMLVGAIIGGDAGTIFMVGGGALGLYGLYTYLR